MFAGFDGFSAKGKLGGVSVSADFNYLGVAFTRDDKTAR